MNTLRAAATAAVVVASSVASGAAAADADSSVAAAAAAEAAVVRAAAHPAAPADGSTVFFENFDGEPQFALSDHADYAGQDVRVKAIEGSAFTDDNALVLMSDAHRYGITLPIDSATANDDDDLVIQYEVRLSKGLECGGAYLKLLDANALPEGNNITPDSPYIIMFGPDKCGDNNKVHFILRHENPVSHEWEEKHFQADSPLTIQSDKFSHLYTLIVRQDNTFTIKVDNIVQKSGHLLESMKPAINPPAEISDPEDSKPSDWVDDAKIPDPASSKPDDWDEEAPKTILDASVEMPDGWLESEAYLVPDPAAAKPEEWDDEDDGEWEAPQVQNPKCAAAPGCEKWVRPSIANPAYKGKWAAPMIDNPAYTGQWAPRQIANPNFFVDATPAKGLVGSIGAVGVEVWIHKHGGVTFDNVLVSTNEETAAALADATFKTKAVREKANVSDLERQRRHEANLKLLEHGGALGVVQYYFYETLDLAREWPIAAGAAGLTTVALLIYLCCVTCCAAGDEIFEEEEEEERAPGSNNDPATASSGSGDAAAEDDEDGSDDGSDDDDDAPALVAKPQVAKKND